MAYRYLSYKPRSVYEMRQYLKKKAVQPEDSGLVIQDLIDKKFLGDEQFAKWYIENRTRFNPRSIFAIRYELRQKGIKDFICDPILEGYDDYDLAMLSVQSKLNRWKGLCTDDLKKKLMNHLNYRGFSFHVSLQVFESIQKKDINP